MSAVRHFMLDLETAGTLKNAAILTIGCVPFTFPKCVPDTDDIFYRRIDTSVYDRLTNSFSMSVATTKWWMEQTEEARKEAWMGNAPLHEALKEFTQWINKNVEKIPLKSGKEICNMRLWAHGKEFDPLVMENALQAMGIEVPWIYSQTRDTRSVFEVGGIQKLIDANGDYGKHHAVGDCLSQIHTLAKACANKREEWEE